MIFPCEIMITKVRFTIKRLINNFEHKQNSYFAALYGHVPYKLYGLYLSERAI